ncbi:hypothetical protein HPB48_019744 [Haemaphysalis longicornis]|uniref:Uncharacterized protein n=1 Tax=Haemaphysalis longicornis TaxID=44386 RepID=A0A9J6FNW2_HAELO|nr:hypothetical protein HPB48_019744 [Haemaphysalis longicornis]
MQPIIKSKFEQPKELPLRQREEITAKIARMLVLDLQPYDFVESRGFRELVHEMEPLYKTPCRTTFSRTVVPELYRDTCLGHTLQLAIKDSKEIAPGVPDIWKKCRAIVGHYKHSAKATASLQDCQRQLVPTLKLIQDLDKVEQRARYAVPPPAAQSSCLFGACDFGHHDCQFDTTGVEDCRGARECPCTSGVGDRRP